MKVSNARLVATLAISLFPAIAYAAAHPVLVEGNCDSPVPGTTIVSAGTCGDYDGDGRIGTAEDTDGSDRIFGTINAALGAGAGSAAGTGTNQNGVITIVTSGRFAEQITITGNVTLEAAPGVVANLDAVLQGDPAGGNNTRQAGIGIVVNGPATGRVILRNIVVRNFAEGIRATTNTRLTLIDVRLENNLNYAVRMMDDARLMASGVEVLATGYRIGTTGTCPSATCTPAPGHGIVFEGSSSGAVAEATLTGSYGSGLVNASSRGTAAVRYDQVFYGHNEAGAIVNATRYDF